MADQLKEQFSIEFRALCEDKQTVLFELGKSEAWAIFSQLQLALRHPKNNGATANIARKIAEDLERQLATTPALKEVARRGWDAKFDE